MVNYRGGGKCEALVASSASKLDFKSHPMRKLPILSELSHVSR